MNINYLKSVAEYHAKHVIRTKCIYQGLSLEYKIIDGYYYFYALYRCKRRINSRFIIVSKDGEVFASYN